MSLQISGVIGVKGDVAPVLHPDGEHLIYALGSTVLVRHLPSKTQHFLRGHDSGISCVAVSPCGRFLASGQRTHVGFPADVMLWDFSSKSLLHRLSLHKGAVQSVAFSPDSQYLASAGGRDDNALVLWSLNTPTPSAFCGTSLSGAYFHSIAFFHASSRHLITCGGGGQGGSTGAVKLWYVDLENRKLRLTDVNLGTIKRLGSALAVSPDDKLAYVGTSTGDVVVVDLEHALFKGVSEVLCPGGVRAIELLAGSGDLVLGSGTGLLVRVRGAGASGVATGAALKVQKKGQVVGAVSGIASFKDASHAFVLTEPGNLYLTETQSLSAELKNTAHRGKITSIAFPFGLSDVFMTTSHEEIRVWNAKTKQEILRISVPGVTCNVANFTKDGRLILSGWGDGKIRGFLPQSGRLAFVVNDAHRGGVTALTSSSGTGPGNGGLQIISGGEEGEVRVWRVTGEAQASWHTSLVANLKEHRGRVYAVKLKGDLSKCVSASADGSCIVWDLKTGTRQLCLFESTMFKAVVYHPDEAQLITAGSDRKITFWDVFDGQAIRTLEGSETSEVNTLAIGQDGAVFVSAGGDGLVKLWLYDEGVCKFVGTGHSSGDAGAVNMVKIAPNGEKIVSVGDDGAIFIWDMPSNIHH